MIVVCAPNNIDELPNDFYRAAPRLARVGFGPSSMGVSVLTIDCRPTNIHRPWMPHDRTGRRTDILAPTWR